MIDRLTVVLLESSYLVMAGVEQLLGELPGLLLTEVFDGSEKNLAQKIIKLKPNIIIINPDALEINTVTLINTLRTKNGCLLIGLCAKNTPENVKSHFTACLNLDDGKFELLEEFKAILGKRIKNIKEEKIKTGISGREKTIIKEVVSGLTNQEIANKLFLSIHTVTTHRKNITNKLGIKTVSGLTVYAILNKIVDIHEIEHK